MIQFYKKRYIFFGISLVVLLIGVIALFVNRVQMDIQFKGGSILKYVFAGEMDIEKADRVATNAMGGRNATCQITTDLATETTKLVVNLGGNQGLSAEEQDALDTALKEAFPNSELVLSESNVVEPFIGKRFFTNSILSILLSFFLIVIYVWFRFRKIGGLSAGVMALVALLHDVCIVFFVFVMFKMPVNENFIAAALTIVGYSINDTIVIYDRIRENARIMRSGTSTEELVYKSITQSMSRSINTSVTTFVSILIVYIFAHVYGISSIKSFAFPMMFGIVSGCYSSVCIAGPLWVMWNNFRGRARVKA